jgi:hypothetical protein
MNYILTLFIPDVRSDTASYLDDLPFPAGPNELGLSPSSESSGGLNDYGSPYVEDMEDMGDAFVMKSASSSAALPPPPAEWLADVPQELSGNRSRNMIS